MRTILTLLLFLSLSGCIKAQMVPPVFMVVNNSSVTPPGDGITVADKTLFTYSATNRYLAFGNNFRTQGDTILQVNRNGSTHLNSGRVEMRKNAAIAKTTTAPQTILTPPTNKDYRCGLGGVVGGEKVALFFTQYDYVAGTFDKNFYILSNNLSATAWSTPVDLPLPSGVNNFVFFGNLIASDVASTYYQPCYGGNTGNTENVVWLYKFNYIGGVISGVSIIEIYRGSQFLTETSVERLGGGVFLALSRVNGRNVLMQTISTDGGNSWSTPADTNMGDGLTYTNNSASDIVPEVKLRTDTIICVFQNRVTGWLQMGKKALSAIGSATGWVITNYYQLNIPGLGYATMCRMPGSTNVFLLSWCKEVNSLNATIYTRQEDFN